MKWIAGHRKLLAAIAGGAVTVLVTIYGTDAVWVQTIILAATALGVYTLPNTATGGAAHAKPPP